MSEQLLQTLKNHALLSNLPHDRLVAEVLPFVTPRRLENGEALYCQGDPARNFYLVTAGELEVLQEEGERTNRINFLYPGEFCGDTALLYEEPQPVTIRSSGVSEVLVMEGAAFLDLYMAHKPLQRHLLRLARVMEARANRTFEGQADDEIVIFFERRHWIALARAMGGPVGLVFVWFLGMGAAAYFLRDQPESQITAAVVGLALLIIPLVWGLWQLFDWLNDYYIITNQRVIHIEQVYGIMKERYEAPMSKIQNVNLAQMNVIAEMLGYGKLIINTAATGGQGVIILDPIGHPTLISKRILHEQNRAQSVMAAQEQGQKRRALRAALGIEPAAEPPTESASPPSQPVSGQPVIGLLQRLYFYLRPTTREVRGQLIVWRKHPLWLAFHAFPAYTLLLILIGLGLFAFSPVVTLTPQGTMAVMVGGGILLLINLLWLLWIYDDWRNDLYILTPDGILDEEKKPLNFKKEVRRATLDMIQDVQYRQSNPIFVWMGIGHVRIQTAGQDGDFNFNWVEDPHRVQMDIFQAIQRRQRERQTKESATINREVLDLLKLYDEARREERSREEASSRAAEATTRVHRPDSEAPTRPSPPAP